MLATLLWNVQGGPTGKMQFLGSRVRCVGSNFI